MKLKRLLSLILAMLIMAAPLQSLAFVKETEIYLCDGFGEYETYTHQLREYSISDSTAVKIIESGKKNKALLLLENSAVSISRNTQKEFSGQFVYSLELKGENKPVSADIGLLNGANKYSFLKILNNAITMNDGKKSKSLRLSSGCTLSMIIDNSLGYISVFVNDGCVIDKWKIAEKNTAYTGIYLSKESGSGSLIIDSISVYEGNKISSKIKDTAYSPTKGIDMIMDQYPNNNTFFDSDYIVTASKKYLDATLGATGEKNSYVGERLDYKNTEKGDRIILRKEDDDTVYNHVYLNMGTTMASELYPETYYYKNYSLEGNFCITTAAMSGPIMFLADKTVSPVKELSLVSFTTGGNIRVSGVGNVAKVVPNNWNHIAIYINLEKHTGDLFLNGELVAENFAISNTIKNLSLVRTSINGGKGELQLRKWVFKGLKHPMEKQETGGKIVPVVRSESQFPDDSVVKEYLADKIVLHGDGDIIYKERGVYVPPLSLLIWFMIMKTRNFMFHLKILKKLSDV